MIVTQYELTKDKLEYNTQSEGKCKVETGMSSKLLGTF